MAKKKTPERSKFDLSLDFGNTRVKAGLFSGRDFQGKIEFDKLEGIESFYAWIEGHSICNVICSSVDRDVDPASMFSFKYETWLNLNQSTLLPFKNGYQSPETLGNDRLAAVAGAIAMFPGQDVLVFDAGSCLTSEFVDRKGIYHGGSISPGVKMRFRAMNEFTARLPLIDPQTEFELTGKNTKTSMISGVIMGMSLEIDGFIDQYKMMYPKLEVVLTGGDHIFFEKNLKNDIFVAPNLVLQGLNEILYHNHAF